MVVSFNLMGVISAEFSKPACHRLNRQERLRQKNQEPAALAEEKSESDSSATENFTQIPSEIFFNIFFQR